MRCIIGRGCYDEKVRCVGFWGEDKYFSMGVVLLIIEGEFGEVSWV